MAVESASREFSHREKNSIDSQAAKTNKYAAVVEKLSGSKLRSMVLHVTCTRA